MARVLIVEDSFIVAQMIADVVAQEGHEAIGPVGGAAQALEVARRRRPDLVILDLQLVEGDVGEALARQILADTDAAILLCTAFGDWVLQHVEASVRPCATIGKPIDLGDLRAAIKRCLESDRPGPSSEGPSAPADAAA